MTNAKTTKSNFTSSSEEKDAPSAEDAGTKWQTRTRSGEKMERFHLNSAKSFLGKNVNLHLKDGSVIINVQLSEIKKDEYKKEKYITYTPYGNKRTFTVPMKNIAWAEMLNLNLILSR
jgi:hypothetical protein